ncbi:MAG: hypothetical protein H6861_01195 [Rhodospirillales bacterium]|nr:hypothetical protein [Rhodospirillales bacterium]
MDLIAQSSKYDARRATVEELPCFTVGDIARGIFTLPSGREIKISEPSYFSHVPFILLYEEGGRFRQSLYLEYTKQPFGGQRTWLLCPDCGRRCTKLHIYKANFGCRVCFGLGYKSQQLTPAKYHEHQALKIESALGEDLHYMLRQSIFDPPPRPKHMRRVTYEKLTQKLNEHKESSLAKCCKIMNRIICQ